MDRLIESALNAAGRSAPPLPAAAPQPATLHASSICYLFDVPALPSPGRFGGRGLVRRK
jgi:hypothetical protein